MLFNVSELSKPLGFTIFASTPKLRESFSQSYHMVLRVEISKMGVRVVF